MSVFRLCENVTRSVTSYFKASPCWSWVCLCTSLNEHLSLWCRQWHRDDPGGPVCHAGYSPPMTSPRQTQCQTEHWCSSHYSSCGDRDGSFTWRQDSERLRAHGMTLSFTFMFHFCMNQKTIYLRRLLICYVHLLIYIYIYFAF